jgi:hypothetical protein
VAWWLAWLLPAVAAAQPPVATPLPRLGIDERLAADGVALPTLDALPGRRAPFPLAVRVRVPLTEVVDGASPAGLARVEARIAALAARGLTAWLAIEAPVPAAGDLPGWSASLRAIGGRVAAQLAWVELSFTGGSADPRLAAFALKQAAVELRATAPALKVLAGGDALADRTWLDRLYREDVAAYLDGVVLPAAGATADGARRTASLVEAADPGSLLALAPAAVASADAVVTAALAWLGSPVTAIALGGEPAVLARGLSAAAALSDLVAGTVVPLDAASLGLRTGPGVAATLVYDTGRFATTLIYAAEDSAGDTASREIALTLRTEARPTLRDPLGRETLEVTGFERNAATQRATFTVPLRTRPLILDLNDGLADAVNERSDVTARSELSVTEIVARHQQARTLEARLIDAYVVRVRMDQHFRPTATDPGFDVVTDNRYFADREGLEWEELSFEVNGTKWGPDRPAFPLLQPEKVLSPPLDLRLDADYRYRLDGTGTVDGVSCYVVRFDPLTKDRSLYRGTVWIDRQTFRRVKLQAVQTGLSAPVVSNDETVRFARIGSIDGRDIHLPVETVARQIVLIAGRNLLVEKRSHFSDYELNPVDFAGRRLEARRSDRVMYRETDRGMRYYVKEGDERIVSDKATTRAKAMAIGTTIDPSYDFPLPILGINYLDFEFGSPDSQLAVLFGGVLALGNVQRPKLLGPFDGSVDFFGIAVPGTDRVYDVSGSRESERLLTWPLSAGGNLGWQYTSFQKLSALYQLRFDGFLRDRTTAEDYVVPRSTTTHGVGLGWEYRRSGYSVVANGTWFGRLHWEPWGPAERLVTSPRTYTKYSLSASKEFYLNVLSKVRMNGAYFGGRRLDRFSQYQFGLFDDTRIHGVPSAGVRFGELAMVRGSYSFNAFEQYRFDVFLDRAWGRDRDAARLLTPDGVGTRTNGDPWEGITGIGIAFNVRAPWNTILRADVGRSFLPDRYEKTGSVVLQVMFLKPL